MSPEQDCALAYESSCASPSILRTPVAVTRAILKKTDSCGSHHIAIGKHLTSM
jgi:hypothetical protein